MDPATLAGVGLALAAVFTSMILEGGNPMAIFLVPPLLLVFVGTLGAAMAGGTLPDMIASLKALKIAFLAKKPSGAATVPVVVGLAERARRDGLLALEDAAKSVDDPFLKEGLQLAIDGTDPEELQEVLLAKIDAKRAADKQAAKFFTDMGGYAPTIGIVGTVLGLIHVLENLSKPAELGHLIAAAFVATLWGVLAANAFWLPIASRLKRISELEAAQMELCVEGVLAIQSGANPRMVARRLESLLAPGDTLKEAA